MRLEKIILVLLASLLLTNCANRSHTGAVLGSTTTTGTCVSMGLILKLVTLVLLRRQGLI